MVFHHCNPSIYHLVMLNKYYGIKKAHLVNIVKNGRCHSLKVTARPSSVLCGWPTNQPKHSSGATILGSYQRLSKRREAGQSWTGQGMYHVNCLHLACILVNVSNIWFLKGKDQLKSRMLKENKCNEAVRERSTYSPWKSRGTCQDSTSFCWRTTTRTG